MENSNKENKVLLTVTKVEDGAVVEVHTKGFEELYSLAHAIASIGEQSPMFTIMLASALKQQLMNPEKSENEVVELPDFNNIFKNLN
jgi:hypothetical protein